MNGTLEERAARLSEEELELVLTTIRWHVIKMAVKVGWDMALLEDARTEWTKAYDVLTDRGARVYWPARDSCHEEP